MDKPYDIEIKGNGSLMVITIDISKTALDAAVPSKTGKSRIVAGTGGFQRIGPVKVSLNVIC